MRISDGSSDWCSSDLILEIGTLGGYSTIWLARALPEGGALVTPELDPRHAAVARQNLERAGVSDRVDIRIGAAADSLAAMTGETPFAFIFLDADKEGNAHYVARAVRTGRSGPTHRSEERPWGEEGA